MAKKATELRPIMTRMPEKLRARLERAAKKSERSMNAEINYRLESSFVWDNAWGDQELRHYVHTMFIAFHAAGEGMANAKGISDGWLDDPDCFVTAMFGTLGALIQEAPAELDPEKIDLHFGRMKARLITRQLSRAKTTEGSKP